MRRWLLLAILGAACASAPGTVGCGHVKPLPDVPPGAASCDQGCANASALPCGLSAEFCLRNCRGIAVRNPAYATCLYKATTCAAENACGGEESDDGATGPGSGRSGP